MHRAAGPPAALTRRRSRCRAPPGCSAGTGQKARPQTAARSRYDGVRHARRRPQSAAAAAAASAAPASRPCGRGATGKSSKIKDLANFSKSADFFVVLNPRLTPPRQYAVRRGDLVIRRAHFLGLVMVLGASVARACGQRQRQPSRTAMAACPSTPLPRSAPPPPAACWPSASAARPTSIPRRSWPRCRARSPAAMPMPTARPCALC